MRFIKYFPLLLVFIGIGLYFRPSPVEPIMLSGQTMGTFYTIKINLHNKNNKLKDLVNLKLKLISKQMSVFDPQSEISRINQAKAGIWMDISSELSTVLKAASEIYESSGGYFDPTVGNLVNIWGFGPKGITKTPTDEQIRETLDYTGFDKIEFSEDFKQLKKKDKRVYLNLSAIAKGYGVDKIAELLKGEGYKDFIVEIGGEVVATGSRNSSGEPWKIGITTPESEETKLVIPLENMAVATSGDYRNFRYSDSDSKKYAHTILPQTGYPVENSLASVTVFHSTCMLADAYATAVTTLGEEKGLEYADKNNLAVIMITHDDRVIYSREALKWK